MQYRPVATRVVLTRWQPGIPAGAPAHGEAPGDFHVCPPSSISCGACGQSCPFYGLSSPQKVSGGSGLRLTGDGARSDLKSLDVVDSHVQRDFHRRGALCGLREHVPTLQCTDQPGRVILGQ